MHRLGDQLLDLVRPEHRGMAQRVPAVLVGPGVGPSQLDQAVVVAVEIAPEQMLEVRPHGGGIGAVSLLLLGLSAVTS